MIREPDFPISDNGSCAASAQLLVVFGVVFALAVLIWFVSQGIRGCAVGRLCMAYYWIVAPGVACHETGHALGCVLTGTRITKFVPFRPSSDGTLGYVEHEPLDGLVDYRQPQSTYLKQNPELLDEVSMIADSLIVRPAEEKDPHWNDKCRSLLKGLILAAVYGLGPNGRRHLGEVRTMLTAGLDRLVGFLPLMERFPMRGIEMLAWFVVAP